MYPFLRFGLAALSARRARPLPIDGMHETRVLCLPFDLDPWGELNNGRTLTLYDLGRVPLAIRIGLLGVLRREGWRLTVAGASVRYRRRVRAFERLSLRSAVAGRDDRFLYVEQSLWRDGEAVSAAYFRKAAVDANGIVATDRILAALGRPDWRPALPPGIAAWAEAEAARPWPPGP